MPTYEYKCPKCATEFEVFQKITSKPGAKCPKCRSKATRQMSGGVGLHFKGSGFYLTDYGRAGQKASQAKREGADAARSGTSASESKSSESTSGTRSETKAAPKSEAKPAKPSKKDD